MWLTSLGLKFSGWDPDSPSDPPLYPRMGIFFSLFFAKGGGSFVEDFYM